MNIKLHIWCQVKQWWLQSCQGELRLHPWCLQSLDPPGVQRADAGGRSTGDKAPPHISIRFWILPSSQSYFQWDDIDNDNVASPGCERERSILDDWPRHPQPHRGLWKRQQEDDGNGQVLWNSCLQLNLWPAQTHKAKMNDSVLHLIPFCNDCEL